MPLDTEVDRLSYIDEELQFIMENFEFSREIANDVSNLHPFLFILVA